MFWAPLSLFCRRIFFLEILKLENRYKIASFFNKCHNISVSAVSVQARPSRWNMQHIFTIVFSKSFLSLVATASFAPVMTEARSDTRAFKFPASLASSWNFLVRHVTIATASGKASSECPKRSEESKLYQLSVYLSTSKNFTKDTNWHIIKISVTSSLSNA